MNMLRHLRFVANEIGPPSTALSGDTPQQRNDWGARLELSGSVLAFSTDLTNSKDPSVYLIVPGLASVESSPESVQIVQSGEGCNSASPTSGMTPSLASAISGYISGVRQNGLDNDEFFDLYDEEVRSLREGFQGTD